MHDEHPDPDGEYAEMTTTELAEVLNELDDAVDGDTRPSVAHAIERLRTYVESLLLARVP